MNIRTILIIVFGLLTTSFFIYGYILRQSNSNLREAINNKNEALDECGRLFRVYHDSLTYEIESLQMKLDSLKEVKDKNDFN